MLGCSCTARSRASRVEESGMEKDTIKGHGLVIGAEVLFHGMANDTLPAIEGTLCVLGKEGAKYTLTSVTEMNSVGKPWVWTFGASAKVWLSPKPKPVSDHEFSAHSRRPDEGRLCGVAKDVHGVPQVVASVDPDACVKHPGGYNIP